MRQGCLQALMLIAVLASTRGVRAAEPDTAAITRLSQAFSDASASGDAKVLDKLLDANVVFMSEDGTLSSKHDIVAGASPPPAGTHNTLVQSDFHVALHGDVAVTSFTDNATFVTYGQTAHDSFRSTEVWLREPAGWKMVSSQTIEVPVDPAAIQLTADQLDQYVGSYQLAPGHSMRIERHHNTLVSIGRDGKQVPLLAEARDVMFRKDTPRLRLVFRRDATGRIAGFVVRRAGHDLQRFARS